MGSEPLSRTSGAPIVSLVVAMAENRVIGRDGKLPWKLPDEWQYFRKLTIDHTVIMGRRTYQELGHPLANRRNVVVSRNPAFRPPGVTVVPSFEEALALGATEKEVFVIGGAALYRVALPVADRLYLTVVHATVEGDTLFPPYDDSVWVLESERHHPADERHRYPFTFRAYARIRLEP